jgi:AraC-like DNA-binding protein
MTILPFQPFDTCLIHSFVQMPRNCMIIHRVTIFTAKAVEYDKESRVLVEKAITGGVFLVKSDRLFLKLISDDFEDFMEIQFYKPSNSLLQKYIESFYILRRQPEDKPVIYVAFPGICYFVTINENSQSIMQNEYTKFTHSPGALPVSDFIYNFDKPHFIEYEGAASELNICFKPLGINAFLENKLTSYSSNYSTPFYPFEDYRQYLADISSIKNIENKLQATENYWLSKLKGFAHPFLDEVIEEIKDENRTARTITQIAAANKTSRTTLHKQFEDHLCTTPGQFRKVVRFRKAMKKQAVKSTIESLTDISNLVNYFDQSHMIKDFKALTNHSPKNFFSKITPLANGKINWIFL